MWCENQKSCTARIRSHHVVLESGQSPQSIFASLYSGRRLNRDAAAATMGVSNPIAKQLPAPVSKFTHRERETGNRPVFRKYIALLMPTGNRFRSLKAFLRCRRGSVRCRHRTEYRQVKLG